MSDFYKEVSNRLYIQFTEKHFQILGYVLAKYFSNYRTELEWGLGGFIDIALLPKGAPEFNYYAIIELKYVRAKDLRLDETDIESIGKPKRAGKSKTAEEIKDERRKIVQEKWNGALEQIKRYAAEPDVAHLDAEGKLKKWIIIFCTHRCLVNQEISDPYNAVMEPQDFDWWFR
jgi:hypothetical protein